MLFVVLPTSRVLLHEFPSAAIHAVGSETVPHAVFPVAIVASARPVQLNSFSCNKLAIMFVVDAAPDQRLHITQTLAKEIERQGLFKPVHGINSHTVFLVIFPIASVFFPRHGVHCLPFALFLSFPIPFSPQRISLFRCFCNGHFSALLTVGKRQSTTFLARDLPRV